MRQQPEGATAIHLPTAATGLTAARTRSPGGGTAVVGEADGSSCNCPENRFQISQGSEPGGTIAPPGDTSDGTAPSWSPTPPEMTSRPEACV